MPHASVVMSQDFLLEEIHNGITSLGIQNISAVDVENWIAVGVNDVGFRRFVQFICSELISFLHLEENVTTIDQIDVFSLELSGVLRELQCPISNIMMSDAEARFSNPTNCSLLLKYLISELQGVRLIAHNNPGYLKKDSFRPQLSVAPGGIHAFWLEKLGMALGFPKPPASISQEEFCLKLVDRVKQVVNSWTPEILGNPIVANPVTPKQWKALTDLNDVFTEEYAIRREMLLTRLDVTIRSFGWGGRQKGSEIEKVFLPLREMMKVRTGLGVASVLAARDDITKIRKTCDPSLRDKTKCDINKAKMGAVPDRGGRANEYDAPPPEMPQWQKRQPDTHRGRGGGHHRGGSASGRGNRGGHGGGNVFDRLDGGGRPHTGGHMQQQFRPQSNFDQFGGGGGGGSGHHSGRGNRRGGRGNRY